MRETGTIIALEEGSAWVETRRQGTCGRCSARQGCGQGILNQVMPGREHYLRALIDESERGRFAVGDRVAIEMADDVVLAASAIVYLLPLAAMLLGAVGGNGLLPGDAGAVGGALAGLMFGALGVRLHARRVRNDPRVQPRLQSLVAGAERASARVLAAAPAEG